MRWSTACVDWRERLKARRPIIPPPIYPEQAEKALAIFKELRVVDLPGKPTFGECSDEWVFDFVRAIFGAYDGDTGRQLIREFGLLIAKKNTKSTIAAGIMITAVILCWREDEEHLILAPTKEVADNSFKPAAGMIRADEELSALFHVQDHIRTITHRVSKASLKVVAADTDTVSGKKSGRILVDELWLFGKQPRASAMFMEATGGQISREEGWVIYLTTQSDEPPCGVWEEKLQYWRDVRDGKILDPKTLGILYEFPEDMVADKAYLSPENFHIANPNLGRSVSSEWLADQLKRKEPRKDGDFQKFIAKHLNIEPGLGLRNSQWPGAAFWEAQRDADLSLEALLSRSEVVAIGIDGGGLDDMLGLAVVGREAGTGDWLHWAHAWIHPIVLDRRKSEATRFQDFARQGDLTIIEKIGDDLDELCRYVAQVESTQLLDRIGVDQAGIGSIVDAITDADGPAVEFERIIGIPQGWKMVGAIKTTERKLAEGTFLHCGSPLMAWCVGNAKVEPRGNAVMITKAICGAAKIDPLMATFNAVSLMSLNPQPRSQANPYAIRGIRSL